MLSLLYIMLYKVPGNIANLATAITLVGISLLITSGFPQLINKVCWGQLVGRANF